MVIDMVCGWNDEHRNTMFKKDTSPRHVCSVVAQELEHQASSRGDGRQSCRYLENNFLVFLGVTKILRVVIFGAISDLRRRKRRKLYTSVVLRVPKSNLQ